MQDTWSRRRVLAGTGALAAATAGGIALSTDNASATVDGEFSIPDGKTVLADQQLQDVRLTADVSWSYEANAPISGIELELHVGATPDTVDMIARHENLELGSDSMTGTETLTGSIISASDFTVDNFQPSSGELRTGVVADLRFYALRNEEVVAEAVQTETFEVVVSSEELTVDMTLSGTGEVAFDTS